jgi:hypothetical protein
VTWLYGPLEAGAGQSLQTPSASPTIRSRTSESKSLLNKRPILKKRSLSEIMLHNSLSSSSLLKRAAAAVQAQQSPEFNEQVEQCISLDIRGIDSCAHSDSKTITSSPSTPLKYRVDTPEPRETTMRHGNGFWTGSRSSPFSWRIAELNHYGSRL